MYSTLGTGYAMIRPWEQITYDVKITEIIQLPREFATGHCHQNKDILDNNTIQQGQLSKNINIKY